MTDKQILEKAKWNSQTAYTAQITYVCEDGYKIHAVYIEGNSPRKEVEDNLIQAVKEHYDEI